MTEIEITRRRPFAHDYERLDGRIHFGVDPAHAANRTIVDLDKAPRDAQGRVRFSADLVLVRPRDEAQSNRRLLYYVVNRGRLQLPFCRAPAKDVPDDELDPGDGFLMKRGWTVAMCGWQWDVDRGPGLLGFDPPAALGADGRPIPGQVAVRFQPNEPHAEQILSHMPLHPSPGRLPYAHKPYPAADPGEPGATMTVRDSFTGPVVETLPRRAWRFTREGTHVALDGGFQPGRVYEVVYTTSICPVAGAGLLAVRDCSSHLRYDFDRPIEHAYGFGVSQCGRFLRQYLLDRVNVDERGRPAFDGLIPEVAGARRGQFNHRYAQPSDPHAPGFGHLPPFTVGEHLGDQTIKVIEPNTSSEYWRADCSLIHTDASGSKDIEPPANARIYVFAGSRHGSGAVPLVDNSNTGARAANALTVVDYSTILRNVLELLDRWVSEGVEPPPSVFPRLSDRTAVRREVVLDKLSRIPGVVPLAAATLPTLRRVDVGPGASAGVGRWPAELGEPYASYVSDVDADGNEVAGIRLPDLTVPVGTHTGWVARHADTGAAGQLLDMMGLTAPLPATEGERQRTGDPRLSIAARYRDRDDYLSRVRTEAEKLASARYLLAEDVDLVVELCGDRYDAFAPQPVSARG